MSGERRAEWWRTAGVGVGGVVGERDGVCAGEGSCAAAGDGGEPDLRVGLGEDHVIGVERGGSEDVEGVAVLDAEEEAFLAGAGRAAKVLHVVFGSDRQRERRVARVEDVDLDIRELRDF